MSSKTNSPTKLERPDSSHIPEDIVDNVIQFPSDRVTIPVPGFDITDIQEGPIVDSDSTPSKGIGRPNSTEGAEFERRVEDIANGNPEITEEHLKREKIERDLAKQALQQPDLNKMDKDSEKAFARGKVEQLG